MSRIVFNKGAAPSAPASGKESLFVNAEGRVQALDSTGVLRTLSDSARYNFVRNGGMWFAMRQVPATLTTYGGTTARTIYGADGYSGYSENASVQYIRTDTSSAPEAGLQGRYYGQLTKITSTGKFAIAQIIEGSNAEALRGRTVRVQVWMKRVVADNNVRLGLVQLAAAGTIDTIPSGAGLFITAAGANAVDPTLGTNLARIAPKAGVSGDNCTANGNAYDCALTSAWQRFGGVFDVPSDCKNLLPMIWTNSQFAATNGFAFSQLSLTDGYELQDFSPQGISEELARCQRYYYKTFNTDQNPTTNVGINTGEAKNIAGKAGAVANSGIISIRFPGTMRVQPTNTLYNPAAANALMRNLTGAADMGATAITLGGEQAAVVIATGVAATAVGDQVGIHASFDAEL